MITTSQGMLRSIKRFASDETLHPVKVSSISSAALALPFIAGAAVFGLRGEVGAAGACPIEWGSCEPFWTSCSSWCGSTAGGECSQQCGGGLCQYGWSEQSYYCVPVLEHYCECNAYCS